MYSLNYYSFICFHSKLVNCERVVLFVQWFCWLFLNETRKEHGERETVCAFIVASLVNLGTVDQWCVPVCGFSSHRIQRTKSYPTLRKSKRLTTYPKRTFHNPKKYISHGTSRWASQPIFVSFYSPAFFSGYIYYHKPNNPRFVPQLSQRARLHHPNLSLHVFLKWCISHENANSHYFFF